MHERLGPLSPAERAELITKKINQLADDPLAPPLEITLAESDQGTDLIVNGIVLLTVTDADAKGVNMDRNQAAQAAAQSIAQVIQDYRPAEYPVGVDGALLDGVGHPGGPDCSLIFH